MKEHQAQQLSGTAPKITANVDGNYEILEAEKHLIHADISKSTYDENTGELIRKVGHVRGFDIKDFLRMVNEHAFIGKNVKIVHDPRPEGQRKLQPVKEQKQATDTAMDPEAMSEQQLRDEYKALFGEESDILAIPAELRIDIKEKRAFIAAEKAASQGK